MTVSSLVNRVDYLGSGIVGPYSYPFRIQTAGDLVVTQTTDTGIETTLLYLTDYTVTGAGARNGGLVTLVAVLPTGYSLTLRRVLALTQLTNIRNQGSYLPETIEDALDRATMTAQQLSEVDSRQLSLPVSSDPAVVSALFPTPQANRAIFWNSTETALEARLLDDSDNVALPGNSRTTSTLTAYLANNAVFNVKDYGAIGNVTHNDTTNIQNCLNAATAGSTVLIPRGTYRITAAATTCLTVDKPLKIIGEGPDGSILQVDASTGAAVDAILVLGGYGVGAQMIGNYFGHFAIMPASGNPGRHCINVDVVAGAVAYAVFDFMRLGSLSSYSFNVENPSLRADGGFYTSTIQDSLISGGVNFDNAGDSIHLYRNTVYSLAGNANQLGIRVNLLAGSLGGTAQGFELVGGNITCAGGIDYLCGNGGSISHIDMESAFPTTNSANALINIGEVAANPVIGLSITNSLLGAGNTNVDVIIRVNYAHGTTIVGNEMGPPVPPRLTLHTTANSQATKFADNCLEPGGLLPEATILDEGIGTIIQGFTSPSTYNQRGYYLAHKSAQSNSVIIEAGANQHSSSTLFGVLHNDPKAPVGALAGVAGATSVGGYFHRVAYVIAGVEHAAGTVSTLTFVANPAVSGKIQLTGVPLGPAGTTARKLYRTKAGGIVDFYLLATIADNVTTTYLDNIADAALVTLYNPMDANGPKPTAGTSFGGSATSGSFRVMGNGNRIFGDGPDIGSANCFYDFAFFSTGASFGNDITLKEGASINVVNQDETETYAAFAANGTDGSLAFGSLSAPANGTDDRLLQFLYNGTEKVRITSAGLKISALGAGLFVKEGANATQGVGSLVAGTLVIPTTKVTATSRIFVTTNVPAGTPGWLQVSARVVGTSFTILSSNAADTSAVAWLITEPA